MQNGNRVSSGGEDAADRSESSRAVDLFSLVLQRREFLASVRAGEAHKRDLIDRLDHSRSTVDRALADLLEAELVDRLTDGSFTLTQRGRLLLEETQETLDTVAGIEAAGAIASHLSTEEPVPPWVFAQADVRVATGPDPLADSAILRDGIEEATRLRAFSIADHDPSLIRTAYRQSVLAESLSFEAVFTRAMIEQLLDSYPELFENSRGVEHAGVYFVDSLPFGMFILEDASTRRLVFPIHDDQGVYRGLTVTTDARAIDWAESVFAAYRENAVDAFSAY